VVAYPTLWPFSAFFPKVILHIGIKRINVTSTIGLLVGSGPCIREVGGNAGAPFAHPMGRASPPTLQLLRLNEGSTHSNKFLSTITFFVKKMLKAPILFILLIQLTLSCNQKFLIESINTMGILTFHRSTQEHCSCKDESW
jgi:hypothetical protein